MRCGARPVDGTVYRRHGPVTLPSRNTPKLKSEGNTMERILNTTLRHDRIRHGLRPKGFIALTGALLLAAFLVVAPGGGDDQASAATPPTVEVCNGILNADAQTVECHVTVANAFNVATGVGSSVVTVRICAGAPGVPGTAPCGPTTTTAYGGVITAVNQCNGSGNSGGSVVVCDVVISNTITGSSAVTAGTVNQCNGSGEGGGALPLNCGPPQSTSGATITQCNGSGNGGGATQRVTCSFGAVTETAALRVTVDQCNGSGNGGGALVVCSASEINTVIPVGTPQVPGAVVPRGPLANSGSDDGILMLSGSIALLLGTALLLRSWRNRRKAHAD